MNEIKSLKQLHDFLISGFNKYSIQEKNAIIKLLITEYLNVDQSYLIIDCSFDFSDEHKLFFNDALIQLNKSIPVQYVLGRAFFYDSYFKVNSFTLIPRSETEELVHLILNNHDNRKKKVLDIGTGTGCISVSLKKERPNWDVFAVDISQEALSVAKENALLNNVDVSFVQKDILEDEFDLGHFDIIVSNPPYVTDSEKKQMDDNVLVYEPHLALFVSDTNPLIFYKKIAELGIKKLNKNGAIYFEINERFALETIEMCSFLGYQEGLVLKDLQGKDRMFYAKKLD